MTTKKMINTDLYGEIESIKAPHLHKRGELSLSLAREYAALTTYKTVTDEDGFTYTEVSGGVVLGAFRDVLEAGDVKDLESLVSFINMHLTNGYDYPTVNRETETVYFEPYE